MKKLNPGAISNVLKKNNKKKSVWKGPKIAYESIFSQNMSRILVFLYFWIKLDYYLLKLIILEYLERVSQQHMVKFILNCQTSHHT
jgi:hypothetical protein